MPNRTAKKARPARADAKPLIDRRTELAALRKAQRTEKAIQRLTRQLDREMQRTNDRLQALALALSFRSRALEAECDVNRSLAANG